MHIPKQQEKCALRYFSVSLHTFRAVQRKRQDQKETIQKTSGEKVTGECYL